MGSEFSGVTCIKLGKVCCTTINGLLYILPQEEISHALLILLAKASRLTSRFCTETKWRVEGIFEQDGSTFQTPRSSCYSIRSPCLPHRHGAPLLRHVSYSEQISLHFRTFIGACLLRTRNKL